MMIRKKQRKPLSMILALMLVFSLLPWSVVLAAEEDWKISVLNDGTAEITAYHGSESVLIIPNTIDGLTVTSIGGGAFLYKSSLTSVMIPNSVSSIGQSAFAQCTGLTDVTIPDSVTEIGSFAFSGCTGLTSVSLPDSMTNIGHKAFEDCIGLTNVMIPNSVSNIPGDAFLGCTELQSISVESG